MTQKRILLIISGSVAAYKSLELIRRLREHDIAVTAILTKGGQEFITPLAVSSLSGTATYSDLFSLKDETEMGHIRLAREADLVVVAPASADIIAKMATGLADDLATATMLASDKQTLVAPAMNVKMWQHPATQRNIRQIREDGAIIIPPTSGELACGENGQGRMADVEVIVEAVVGYSANNNHTLTGIPHTLTDNLRTLTPALSLKGEGASTGHAATNPLPEGEGGEGLQGRAGEGVKLNGCSALVTAGPTYEALDPVRFIGNRSSGKQGYAIAQSLANAGARVTLVSGPTSLQPPAGVEFIQVETADEMLADCEKSLPVDIAVCAAAVSDWKAAEPQKNKIKKEAEGKSPEIKFTPNPDILQHLATMKTRRPALVIGFAAETENLKENAGAKLKSKGCDWIIANDVSRGNIFGSDNTSALWLSRDMEEEWKDLSKQELAQRLTMKIADFLNNQTIKETA